MKERALSQFLVLLTIHFSTQSVLGASGASSDAAATKKPTMIPPVHIIFPPLLSVSSEPFPLAS